MNLNIAKHHINNQSKTQEIGQVCIRRKVHNERKKLEELEAELSKPYNKDETN